MPEPTVISGLILPPAKSAAATATHIPAQAAGDGAASSAAGDFAQAFAAALQGGAPAAAGSADGAGATPARLLAVLAALLLKGQAGQDGAADSSLGLQLPTEADAQQLMGLLKDLPALAGSELSKLSPAQIRQMVAEAIATAKRQAAQSLASDPAGAQRVAPKDAVAPVDVQTLMALVAELDARAARAAASASAADALKKAIAGVQAREGGSAAQSDKADTASDPIVIAAPLAAALAALLAQAQPAAPQGSGASRTADAFTPSATPAAATPLAAGAANVTGQMAAILAAVEAQGNAAAATGAATQGFDFDAMMAAANQLVAAQAATASAAPAVSAPAALPVAAPLGAPNWNQDVGERINWMAANNQSHAELVLNPPQLGRIEVTLDIKGDQATALFVSANPLVRESLQNALPHLREILLDAGINLGQAHVGAESFQQTAQNGSGAGGERDKSDGSQAVFPLSAPGESRTIGSEALTRWQRQGIGLVDTFA